MLLVRVTPGHPPAEWPEPALVSAVFSGQLHPEASVSLDGGSSWLAAGLVAQRLHARGSDELALIAPQRTEPWSVAAGYVALFSLLFFGGPIALVVVLFGFDTGPKIGVRLAAVAIGLLLAPLPPALMGWLGLRAIRKDPTYRGKGRAIFALVVGALLAAPCLVALGAVALVR